MTSLITKVVQNNNKKLKNKINRDGQDEQDKDFGFKLKIEALVNFSICHPEQSEGSVFSTSEADPSLCSG